MSNNSRLTSMNSLSISSFVLPQGDTDVELLTSRKHKLEQELESLRQQISVYENEISDFQKQITLNSDKKTARAVELFNAGKFEDCFENLASLGIIHSSLDPVERVDFLRENMDELKVDFIHKFLFKPRNSAALENFVSLVPIAGLSLLEAIRECFSVLGFKTAEADVITRIYQYISRSYFKQNPERAKEEFAHEDVCEILAGAILFINTSINNPNVKEKDRMTEDQFASFGQCEEIRKLIPGGISKEYMAQLYKALKVNPLKLHTSTRFKRSFKEGYLEKQGGKHRSWKRRYFALETNMLYYYSNKETKESEGQALGVVVLQNMEVQPVLSSTRKFCFELVGVDGHLIMGSKRDANGHQTPGNHSRYVFKAASEKDRDDWMRAIKDVVHVNLFGLLRRGFSLEPARAEKEGTYLTRSCSLTSTLKSSSSSGPFHI